MKKLTLLTVMMSLLVLAACDSDPYVPRERDTSDGDPANWSLIWEDQFDGAAGDPVNAASWNHDVGGDGWGNQQLEHNTDRTENVSLDGQGNLQIVAREESYQGNSYTSGRIHTRGKVNTRYGRIEARIKMPVGQGLWPAFWMMGEDIDFVGWPNCGEIDIMEYRGQQPNRANFAVHGPGYSGGMAPNSSTILAGTNLNDDFHTYTMEWTTDTLTWLVDGETYWTLTSGDLSDWVFDDDFFILLNVAVGGTYVGSPDATTVFPQTMLVDWVRIYAAE